MLSFVFTEYYIILSRIFKLPKLCHHHHSSSSCRRAHRAIVMYPQVMIAIIYIVSLWCFVMIMKHTSFFQQGTVPPPKDALRQVHKQAATKRALKMYSVMSDSDESKSRTPSPLELTTVSEQAIRFVLSFIIICLVVFGYVTLF